MEPTTTITVTRIADGQSWTILTDAVLGYKNDPDMDVKGHVTLTALGLGECVAAIPSHQPFPDWAKQNLPQFTE